MQYKMSHNQSHICHCLRRIRSLRQDLPITIDDNRRRLGKAFADDVISLANGIYKLGIRSGDVVAIAALNSDFYMEWLLAISYIGGIVAPLNYRWSFEEAKFSLEIINPSMLVVDESCSSWAVTLQNDNCISSLKLYAFIGGSSFRTYVKSRNFLTVNAIRTPMAVGAMPELMWAPNGIAIICFTSGTTGRPKGVALSHTALTVQSLAKIAIVGYNENDVYLHTAPLCHIGGISSCIAMLMVAGCHVFMPKFDAKSSFITINENQVTSLITVPAMLSDLVSYARSSEHSNGGKTVNKILNGGGGLSSELNNLAALTFPQSKIISAYGMTECCSSLTFMTLHDPFHQNSRKSHSSNIIKENENENVGVLVGKPAPHIELRVSGDSDNLDSPLVGSILTRGLHVMIGYYGTKNNIIFDSIENGWLDTGDVGWIDGNGNLWLVGRKKDRIKSGGENIYPEEVETVLSQHPGVLKAVVIGIPNSRLGEMAVACIIIRDSCKWFDINSLNATEVNDLSTEVLQKYCQQQKLSRFKIPKIFIPWKKPLPLTTTGKLKRDDLKNEVMLSMKFSSNL